MEDSMKHKMKLISVLLAGTLMTASTAYAQASCKPDAPDIDGASAILLNQVGFELNGPKTGILRTTTRRPVPWNVRASTGEIIASGKTVPFGKSEASGDKVHLIEIEQTLPIGEGYTLSACNTQSRPFSVSATPYRALAVDALSYFYQNRSAVPIEPAYVPDAQWARAAGHTREVVTCFKGKDQTGTYWPGCDHKLDVTGGWYDAGDYGKYSVNGGISVWMMLNAVERMQTNGGIDAAGWGDGRVPMPENGNGLSDIMDEARFELEFLMSLQIPQGARMSVAAGEQTGTDRKIKLTERDVSGLVHHKVHAEKWPALPLLPKDAAATRYVYPPSTAGTLNMVAVAAQCARLWRGIDDQFAGRCLTAAVTGYAAALRNPDVYAYNNFDGGGPYDDMDLSDEFGWAATELYATTGDASYLQNLTTTPGLRWLMRNRDNSLGDTGWRNLDQMPAATIIAARNSFSENDRARAKTLILTAADRYLSDAEADGYGVPYPASGYGWGSNGAIASRSVMLGYAYDLTGDERYRDAMVAMMDYFLGRNPLDQSYIAGYGARAVKHVHHRFWAEGADASYPPAAPGAFSGGPNAGYEPGEHQKTILGECAPQTCWADDYSAYALNEVAINWNAALFWLAAYLDTTPPQPNSK